MLQDCGGLGDNLSTTKLVVKYGDVPAECFNGLKCSAPGGDEERLGPAKAKIKTCNKSGKNIAGCGEVKYEVKEKAKEMWDFLVGLSVLY